MEQRNDILVEQQQRERLVASNDIESPRSELRARRSSVSNDSSNKTDTADSSESIVRQQQQHRKQSLDDRSAQTTEDEKENFTRRKLGPIKSLNSSNADSRAATSSEQLFDKSKAHETTTTTSINSNENKNSSSNYKSTNPQQQQEQQQKPSTSKSALINWDTQNSNKQMFSFKQLALNSRNLAKKRGSLQAQQQTNQQAKLQDKCKQLIRLKSGKTTVDQQQGGQSKEAAKNNNSQSNSSSSESSDNTVELQRERQKQNIVDSSSEYLDDDLNDHDDDDYESLESESDSDSFDLDDDYEDYDDYDYDYDDYDDDDDDEEGEGDEDGQEYDCGEQRGKPDDDEAAAAASVTMKNLTKLNEKMFLKKQQSNIHSAKNNTDQDETKETKLERKKKQKRRQLSKKSSSQRVLLKRGSCGCHCEPFVHRVDLDGQLITDVDLVTYKHLCQMEHQAHNHHHQNQRHHLNRRLFGLQQQQQQQLAHQFNTPQPAKSPYRFQMDRLRIPKMTQSTRSKSTLGGGNRQQQQSAAKTRQYAANINASKQTTFVKQQQQSCRRSSLQEESGAYYQLCTSQEEQSIRAKYLWFPPSLKTLSLVDKFFRDFPKDKIPLVVVPPAASAANQPTTTSQQQQQQSFSDKQSVAASSSQQQAEQTAAAAPNPANAASSSSSLVGSYRDEQISFQLPRQDISLDYCSYHMDEPSRLSFTQFVHKRNTQALDVGTVVQISCSSSSSCLASTGDTNQQQAKYQAHNRKSNSNAAARGHQLQPHHHHAGSTMQRCRRCLVRFDDGQLAILASNFAIGTKLPPITTLGGAATNNRSQFGGGDSKLHQFAASAANSRRASIVSSISCLTMQENQLVAATTTGNNKTTQPTAMPEQQQQQTAVVALRQQPQQQQQNVAMFHPQCFTCSTCKEFLVDLVYCLRDGRLYCLRHYGESLRPRCDWCQELIFSEEYLKAMNENFHVDHFLCRHCDSNLAGQRYVLKEEKPYCIQCYEGNFAHICEDCQKPIGIDSKDLSYKDRHWHDTCFLCNKCQQSLIDKPFGSKSDRVYCADCYEVAFATRCDGCQNPFRAGSRKMEYRGRQWHDSCFCCCVCQTTIGSNSFIPKNDEIYCIKCYEDKYATRCTKCKQVIVSGGVTFRNEPWHRDCFNCCHCQKSLAGQRFTTRDSTTTTTTTTNSETPQSGAAKQSHNAYCIDCYGELFAKKCFACSKAITGLGGTRFVTFEDRSWHNDCFICHDCDTSLVGKGFITDGPETILCSECARAKLR